jgi:hypothetical protein
MHIVRQAIVTRYIPATNTKPSRVKATADAGSVMLSWNCALNIENNHAFVAKALAEKFGWRGAWYQGGMPGSGFAFVCLNAIDGDNGPAFSIER